MKIFDYLKYENQIYKDNNSEIEQTNSNSLKVILIAKILIFFTLATLSLIVKLAGYGNLGIFYLVMFFVLVAIFLFVRGKSSPISYAGVYLVYTVALIYCILSSSINPQYICVTILAIILQIPIIYLDKSVRINLFVVMLSAVYLVAISPYKEQVIFLDEVVNVTFFVLLGMIVGHYTRKNKLENIVAKNKLNHFAYYDSLTNIYNRRRLYDDLSGANKSKISTLAIMDIDYFKLYNDTYGHQKGDECLRIISSLFNDFQNTHNVRFYRYGGEEFVMLFYGYEIKEALKLLDEIQKSVENLNIEHQHGLNQRVTLSIGVARFDCKENEDLCVYNADQALYIAKTSGKNRTVLYN